LLKYSSTPLIDKYDIYQHLMTYWNETMQDDCYIISADGWKAETYRIVVKNKDKGWTCDLLPKELVTNRYFKTEKQAIADLETQKEQTAAELTELGEEHSGEDGVFADLEKVNKANVQQRLKEVKAEKKNAAQMPVAAEPQIDYEKDAPDEEEILRQYLNLSQKLTALNKQIKEAEKELDEKLYARYPALTVEEIKTLVVDDKWMHTIETAIKGEIDHISQRLTNRIKELAGRYETPLPEIDREVKELESKVKEHLENMGFNIKTTI